MTSALLPEPVRARVQAVAAEALGRLDAAHVPASLKRVAAFAPARRARLAGSSIVAAIEADEELRDRLATQARALLGEVGSAVLGGAVPAAADPVEVAAAAYLLRPDGWEEVVAEATAALADAFPSPAVDEAELARLRRRAEAAEDRAASEREKARDQLAALRQENERLRKRLGETRAALRAADAALAEASGLADSAAADAAGLQAAAEAEARRLRGRVVELEDQLKAARRTDRAAKVDESVRARLLLETLEQAARGLQRELGLAPLERLPADVVAEALGADRTAPGARTSSGRGSLALDDPALVTELLKLPRTHLLLDGYNVTKTVWPSLPLERQRERLLSGAATLAARTGVETTVVFDAHEKRERPVGGQPRGVRVLFSPYGVIADDLLRDLAAAEPVGRSVVVVTDDRELAADLVEQGCRVVSPAACAPLLGG